MEAIVISIHDHPERTSREVIRTFLNTYQPDAVRHILLEIFCTYAVSPRKNLFGLDMTNIEVAGLFDGLIELTTLAHELRDHFETG